MKRNVLAGDVDECGRGTLTLTLLTWLTAVAWRWVEFGESCAASVPLLRLGREQTTVICNRNKKIIVTGSQP